MLCSESEEQVEDSLEKFESQHKCWMNAMLMSE